MSGDIFGCYTWVVDATGILWVEAGGAVQHPTMHRAVPAT